MNAGTELHLHHVGFVVRDIEASMHGFVNSLGARWDGSIFEDPNQRVKVAFLSTGSSDAQIELVASASEQSPVRNFLEKQGGGLHHLCYEVSDLEEAIVEFRSRKAVLTKQPLPAVAFAGRRIAWLITREKLLVELLERSSERTDEAR